MEENKNITKITYSQNLASININSTINMQIDANVNIKTVLDVNPYIYDTKIECGNGKAILNGKLGLKVVYLDTDNLTNTITDSTSFSETITNSSITNECYLNISNHVIKHSILSQETNLKINFETTINPIMYLNIPIGSNLNTENLIVKKSDVSSNCILNNVNTNFEYTSSFETKENVTKILSCNTYYTNEKVTCNDKYAVAEGKLYASILYETTENEKTKLKQLTDCFNIKTDINIDDLTTDCLLDVDFIVDYSKQNLTTEIEDNNSVITLFNVINVIGVCTKNINIEVVDDLYSTENEIDLTTTTRNITKEVLCQCIEDTATSEIIISNEDTAIDEVVANLNINIEPTNTYIKNNSLYLEGIISSNLIYVDENKDLKTKICEIPFIINSKISASSAENVHSQISANDCKVKVKRGTIIELEYKLNAKICVYEQISKEIVSNINIGNPLNFTNYDYQIYLTKPNETMWELCKRIKTTPENITKYNKNLPLELTGKEKIIIKR